MTIDDLLYYTGLMLSEILYASRKWESQGGQQTCCPPLCVRSCLIERLLSDLTHYEKSVNLRASNCCLNSKFKVFLGQLHIHIKRL